MSAAMTTGVAYATKMARSAAVFGLSISWTVTTVRQHVAHDGSRWTASAGDDCGDDSS